MGNCFNSHNSGDPLVSPSARNHKAVAGEALCTFYASAIQLICDEDIWMQRIFYVQVCGEAVAGEERQLYYSLLQNRFLQDLLHLDAFPVALVDRLIGKINTV